MRAVLQRVSSAEVRVDQKIVGAIQRGVVVLLGIHQEDTASDADWLARKITSIRLFPSQSEEDKKMDRSVLDVQGEALVISQFTLYGECSKGRRPDCTQAAPATLAQPLYEAFVRELATYDLNVATGLFGAQMALTLTNEGPFTLVVETPNQK